MLSLSTNVKRLPFAVLVSFICLVAPHTHASSSGTRGGGDACEDRFKVVRDDLSTWIDQGGAATLSLPTTVSVASYETRMRAELKSARIRCVGHGDPGYPVRIGSTPKVCIFKKGTKPRITCDFAKFQALNQVQQYVIVHHEYAGLSDLETPDGDDSRYDLSDQITFSLNDDAIKRLVVRSSEGGREWIRASENEFRTIARTLKDLLSAATGHCTLDITRFKIVGDNPEQCFASSGLELNQISGLDWSLTDRALFDFSGCRESDVHFQDQPPAIPGALTAAISQSDHFYRQMFHHHPAFKLTTQKNGRAETTLIAMMDPTGTQLETLTLDVGLQGQMSSEPSEGTTPPPRLRIHSGLQCWFDELN